MKRDSELGELEVYEKINTNKVCLVFIHGLGGQSEQFKDIFNYFGNTFHVISIDIFGHGQSGSSTCYDLEAIAKVYCDIVPKEKQYVLIAHSMGVGISIYMYNRLQTAVKGLFCIGSQYSVNTRKIESMLTAPKWIFNLWRWYYRIGGIYSQSVKQYIFYPSASLEVKRNQLRWNTMSKTDTLIEIGKVIKWPIISDIKVPCLLVVGEYDTITPIASTLQVFKSINQLNLNATFKRNLTHQLSILPNKLHPNPLISVSCGHNPMSEDNYTTVGQLTHFFHHLRILCHPPSQSKEFKMDDPYALKNYKKWKAIQGVSDCIGTSKFRAMKIPREVDDEHSPKIVIENYKNIGLVVDMSRDKPPYHPEQFQQVPSSLLKYNRSSFSYECTGDSSKPMYIKQSFISKIPPSDEDVDYFVELCRAYWTLYPTKEIALHCHYGYNRTGFMIISAMYKLGLTHHIMDGVELFKLNRSPGIK